MLSKSKGVDPELTLYQIYFKENQLEHLYDYSVPYFNDSLTDYFENSVIAKLVPQCPSKRIGVCSWRLKQKRGDLIRSKKELLRESLIDDYDIAILTPRSPTHKPLYMASVWHGPAWNVAIKELKKFIKIPLELKVSIYENHFVAVKDLYNDYVNTCLLPCMDFMSSRPCFFVDAGYAKRKSAEEVQAYRKLTGRNDWPLAPFVLERLFSIWIHNKGFKIVVK